MQKLLIADSSDIFMSALEAALAEQYQIATCADGKALPKLLADYRPDVLILNLMLPYQDGLTALRASPFLPPVIMAITMHMNAYVQHAVMELGIDYVMISPSVAAVVFRLQDLVRQYAAPAVDMSLEDRAIHYLHLLNFQPHLDGYRQLCLALPMFARDPQMLMTKELYPAVAQLCGCKDGRSVEHSIRKAIRSAWSKRDNAIWRKYFSCSHQDLSTCPTNKEFICSLAEVLNARNYLL